VGPPTPPITPPATTTATPTATPPLGRDPLQYSSYSVREGDTLSGIALDWYGDPDRWHLIAQANPTVDPLRMRVGQVLRLPPRDQEASRTTQVPARRPAGEREIIYIVQAGDTLSSIARMYYQDMARWRVIYDTNRRAIGSEPDRLTVGMRLIIPPPFPRTTASR
jgi:nucleoid-associated protein YgaU